MRRGFLTPALFFFFLLYPLHHKFFYLYNKVVKECCVKLNNGFGMENKVDHKSLSVIK